VAQVPPERIRNVLLLGHTGTGTSTLAEAMLRAAGHTTGHGPRPSIVDVDPEELERGHSLSLGVVSFEFDHHRFNVLDAPGGAEAIGDAYPALPAVDVAVFVVDATVGVQPQHVELWRACEERRLPRVVLLNKLDLERSRYQQVVDDLAARYGTPLAPIHVPLWHDERFEGVIDLLHAVTIEEHDGLREDLPLSDDERAATSRNRERLVEAIVETDDDLLARYLDGQQPTVTELVDGFAHGVATCGFFPVLCAAAREDIGVDVLLQFLIEDGPSPAAATGHLPLDGPTTVYVAKTFADQYVGRINLLRVLAGTVRTDTVLRDQRTGRSERLRQLFRLRGSEHLAVDEVGAGDLVCVGKLDDASTGDVLTAGEAAVTLGVPEPPQRLHRVVLAPASAGDDAKLSLALQRICQEDPAIDRAVDEDTHQRILGFLGPTHVDVTVARLARRYGVAVEVRPAPVPYRSTIRTAATAVGRNVKQTGGHGQYAVVTLELEPRPRGTGVSFEDRSVGGVVPGRFVPSVEKGVRAAARRGPLAGAPVVDVLVRLVDGKHHPVDSSDGAFQVAGSLAFRAAVAEAEPILLEPVSTVRVTVPDELTGTVLADLASRRGRIVATSASGGGWNRIEALVPDAEVTSLASDLRALTGGLGTADVRQDHHAEVPEDVARRVLGTAGV
jgi:elongation factor G